MIKSLKMSGQTKAKEILLRIPCYYIIILFIIYFFFFSLSSRATRIKTVTKNPLVCTLNDVRYPGRVSTLGGYAVLVIFFTYIIGISDRLGVVLRNGYALRRCRARLHGCMISYTTVTVYFTYK